MWAVVLVGGFGTRLRPLTNEVPKPMLPVAHRPMIVRLVERLETAGVTDVVLALGFKPEPFAAAFPGGRLGELTMHYVVEPEPLDTAGAIAFAAREVGVDDTFLVANGDIMTDLDAAVLVDRHRELGPAGVQATIHLTPVADPSAFGVVETGPDGVVARFVEKPQPGETTSNLVNAGTYVLDPSVLDLVAPGEKVSIERVVFPRLVADRALAAVATDDYWIDAGRPELYRQANLDLVSGRRQEVERAVSAGADVAVGASVRDSVVGSSAAIADGARVVRSVILEGAIVGERAVVVDSVIAGSVGAGAEVRDCVVGSGHAVADGTELYGARVPLPD